MYSYPHANSVVIVFDSDDIENAEDQARKGAAPNGTKFSGNCLTGLSVISLDLRDSCGLKS
jgi:hypothetical protein